ncbi:MAG: hypothetical protein AAF384_01135 [Pseudomonadota bacterium]
MNLRALSIAFFAFHLSFAAMSTTGNEVTVAVDGALRHLDVTVCPKSEFTELRSGFRDASQYLTKIADQDGQPLSLDGAKIPVPAGTRCVSYRFDLGASRGANRRYAYLADSNVAVSASLWLWRPYPGSRTQTFVEFETASQISVPWIEIEAAGDKARRFEIPLSPESDESVTVFGKFAQCDIPVPGGLLKASILRGQTRGQTTELSHWVQQTASHVAMTYGRFPNPLPQVIVVPVAKNALDYGEPVPFGHVIRNGGEAVQFFVNQNRGLEAFMADWTATHEFSHLLIPYIDSREKWISEGLASYYQNVLMARSGMYTQQKAWRKIYEGFLRGIDSAPRLPLEDAMRIGGWDGLMKTYWGGTAVFLMADAELRRRSNNQVSLDSVLGKLQKCCLPAKRVWSGERLFTKLDTLSPEPVFKDLYDRYRRSVDFPDFTPIFADLGLNPGARSIRFSQAPLANVREAIMAPHAGFEPQPINCEG